MALGLTPQMVTPLIAGTLTATQAANLAALVAEVNLWADRRYQRDEYTDDERLVIARYTALLFQRRRERATGQALSQKAGTFSVLWDTNVSGLGLFDAVEVAAIDDALGRSGLTSVRITVDDGVRFGNRLRTAPPAVTLGGDWHV